MRPPEHTREERLTMQRVVDYILEQLNLERGLGYTAKGLLLRPGRATREFLFEDRRRMIKPFPLLMLAVGLSVFFSYHFLDLEAELAKGLDEQGLGSLPPALVPQFRIIILFIRQYPNLALMSSIPFTALATYLVFQDQQLYYAEHLVINTYIYSIQTLIAIFFIPLFPLFGYSQTLGIVLSILVLGYLIYAVADIFEQSWLPGIVMTVLVYLIAQFLYGVFVALSLIVASIFL